ncbi:MAG: PP2C family protein-serine/threonine phosphatase [Bacteroidales bacterium]|nr:PP2C family protein-serine/threonine phosphatase [Bacteroidales bacterium]
MSTQKKISSRIFWGIFIGSLAVFTAYAVLNFFYTKRKLDNLTTNIVERVFRSSYNQFESQIIPVINHAGQTCFMLEHSNLSEELVQKLQANTEARFPYILGQGIIVKFRNSGREYNHYHNFTSEYSGQTPQRVISKSNTPEHYELTIQGDTLTLNYFCTGKNHSSYLLYDFPINLFTNILNKETRQLQSQHYLIKQNDESIICIPTSIERSQEEIKIEIKSITEKIQKNDYGFFTHPDFLKNKALYISRIRNTNIVMASTISTLEMINHFRRFSIILFLLGIMAAIILAYVLQQIVLKITRPITELSALSKRIEKGSLHINIPEHYGDSETEQLSKTLMKMQQRMQRYIADFNSTLKEKRDLDSQISIAEKIQSDMLPKNERILEDIEEIDGYIKLIPAKGVAGDFYDYFMLDPDRFFFILGDVSGKGIPAALFMVKTVTLIQVEAKKGNSPGKILEGVNNQLTSRNDEGMFVTAICGALNIRTGECILADAGHNTPLISINSDDYNYVELSKNMPLGIMDNKEYRESRFELKPQDSIILYSDGLPEALSPNGKMLEYEKVTEELKNCSKKDSPIIGNIIFDLYERFKNNAPANDDITVFILKLLAIHS